MRPADIPAYFQHDWPDTPYGTLGTLDEWGCGPTCLAMVATYLTGEPVSPADAAGVADARGAGLERHFTSAGTAWGYYHDAEAAFGLPRSTATSDPKRVMAALGEGQVAICSQAPGLFTAHGHLIVLRGLDERGRILVRDPWKPHTTELGYNHRAFEPAEVLGTMRRCWLYPRPDAVLFTSRVETARPDAHR